MIRILTQLKHRLFIYAILFSSVCTLSFAQEIWDFRNDFQLETFPAQWKYEVASPGKHNYQDLITKGVAPRNCQDCQVDQLVGWRDPRAVKPQGYDSWFNVAVSGAPINFDLPADAVFVHPNIHGPGLSAPAVPAEGVITWKAPRSGRIELKGYVSHSPPDDCGNGLRWTIYRNEEPPLINVNVRLRTRTFLLYLEVNQGDLIRIRQSALSDDSCDWGVLSAQIEYKPIHCSENSIGVDPDCNNNDLLDFCDIENGASSDIDSNGIPDECQEPIKNNLIQNGSFESGINIDPNPWVEIPKGSSAIPHWNVTLGTITYAGSESQASEGQRSLDLNGSGRGAVSQTISTVPGRSYIVSFDMAGPPSGGPNLREILVEAAEESSVFSFEVFGHTHSDMGWENHQWEFLAKESETELKFTSRVPSGDYGPAIDNVSVVPANDECLVGRSFSTEGFLSGDILSVSLEALNVNRSTTITEMFPSELVVDDAGDGLVEGNTITFNINEEGILNYSLKVPKGFCDEIHLNGTISSDSCEGVVDGFSTIPCVGAEFEFIRSEGRCVYLGIRSSVPFKGGEIGFTYDSNRMKLASIEPGADFAGHSGDILSNFDAGGHCSGFGTSLKGAVVSWLNGGIGSVIPAGEYEILKICFDVPDTNEGGFCSALDFVNCLGTPGASFLNKLTDETNSSVPAKTLKGQVCSLGDPFRRGDADSNGIFDITDPIFILGCQFIGTECPSCPDSADVNDDNQVDLTDAILLLSWRFLGGIPPEAPLDVCGYDRTEDDLGLCRDPSCSE